MINDGEQPSTSKAAANKKTEDKASTSSGKSKMNSTAISKTTAVNGTAKKALETDAKKAATKTPISAVKQSTDVVRKSTTPTATKAAKDIVEKVKTTTAPKATIPLNLNITPKTATLSTVGNTNKSTKLLTDTPTADFERRTKPNTLKLDLTSSPASTALNFDRRDTSSTSIGTRRPDYVRTSSNSISPVQAQSPVAISLPNSATDAVVFSRRSRVATPTTVTSTTATVTTKAVNFERQCNPSPPHHISPRAADSLPDEVRLKSPSFQEARKKLAALTSTTTDSSTAIATVLTLPLASNCNDPRGRNSSYLNSNLSPPKPGQAVPASLNIETNVNSNSTTWSRTDSNKLNIPAKEFPRTQNIPVVTNNTNNNSSHNLSMNKLRGPANNHNLISGSFNNANNISAVDKEPPRRYNNLPSAAELRDPRCGKWINNNGPANSIASQLQQQQQQAQKQQATYAGQGRQGPPYNKGGYNEAGSHVPNWQTVNNKYSYFNNNNNNNINSSNNNNMNNIKNNNQMVWNANNTHNHNQNQFKKGVNKSNANFGYRPAFNRTVSAGGNVAVSSSPSVGGVGNKNGLNKEPCTYGEYLLAKQQRQKQEASSEKQRKLEEAEKQRKLKAAEKQRQLDDDATTEVVATIEKASQSDNVQLDTSYRNLKLPSNNKKLTLKYPKGESR